MGKATTSFEVPPADQPDSAAPSDTLFAALDNFIRVTGQSELAAVLQSHREEYAAYRELFDNTSDAMYIHDLEGRYLAANYAATELVGYSRTEVLGRHISDFVPPEQMAEIELRMREKLLRPQTTSYELEVITRSGQRIPLEVTSRLVFENGVPVGVQGMARDISERKKNDQTLRESEERFRRLFENANDIIFTCDLSGTFTSLNPAGERLTEYSCEEAMVLTFAQVVAPEYLQMATEMLQRKQVMDAPTIYEVEIITKTGRRLALEINSCGIRSEGKTVGVQGIGRDISERRRMDLERQSLFDIIHGLSTCANLEELLKQIHESIQKVLYAENCFVALFDDTTASLAMQFFTDKYDSVPPPQKLGKSCAARVFKTGKSLLLDPALFADLVASGEVELVGKPSPSWLGVPLNTPSRTIGVLVVQHYTDEHAYRERDVEFLSSVGDQVAIAIERKRSEINLNRLVAAVEQTGESVMITDIEGNIQYVNPAFERITGYTGAEVLGHNPRLLKSGKTDPAVYGAMWETISRGDIWVGNLINKRKDGSLFEEYATVSPVRDDSGRVQSYMAVKQDLSLQTRLETQLRQSQRLEAVGQLAGGVAHDFNNLLTVILCYSELSLKRTEAMSPIGRNLGEIKRAAERAASLTRQLLAFSRRQILDPRVLDLNTVVVDMSEMLRRLIGEDIDMVTALQSDLGKVKADPGQVEQIIMNLVVNARDAMPGGGKMTIETADVWLGDEYAHSHMPTQPGPYVMLAISDNGTGMDAETQAQVFEPFFTTKDHGKGTGLGLSTVYGIVKQSGGFIWVYSEPGQGTTFKIYLSLVEGRAHEYKRDVPLETAFNGTETILLTEDEDMVRRLARQVLEMNGYHVLEAASGAAAVAICEKYPEPIHLLLTDVIMPEMSGRELANRLAKIRPEIKVLYMSGYTDDAIAHHGLLDSGITLLQKPFSPGTVGRKVREVLDSATELEAPTSLNSSEDATN